MRMLLSVLMLLPLTVLAQSTKEIDKAPEATAAKVSEEKVPPAAQQQQEAPSAKESTHWQAGPYDKDGNYKFFQKKEDKQPD